MTRQTLTTWVPMGFFCVGAVVNPLVPVWVFLAIMLPGLALMAVGWWDLNREYRDLMEALALEEKWRAERDRWR